MEFNERNIKLKIAILSRVLLIFTAGTLMQKLYCRKIL